MAHFAYVVDGLVERVHVVANPVILDGDGVEQEALGQTFLAGLHGGRPESYVQCSYNSSMRGVYPATGFVYDADLDAFYPQKPEPTEDVSDWVLNEETFVWEPAEV